MRGPVVKIRGESTALSLIPFSFSLSLLFDRLAGPPSTELTFPPAVFSATLAGTKTRSTADKDVRKRRAERQHDRRVRGVSNAAAAAAEHVPRS